MDDRKSNRWMNAAAATLFLVGLAFALKFNFPGDPAVELPRLVFNMDVQSVTPGRVALFFNNRYGGQLDIPASATPRTIAVTLPTLEEQRLAPVWGVRMEFAGFSGAISVQNMFFAEENGAELKRVDFGEQIESLNPRVQTRATRDQLRIEADPSTGAPSFILKGVFPPRTALDGHARVTPATFGALWLALGSLALGLVVWMGRQAVRESKSSLLWLVSIFLVVWGARLVTLHLMGVSFTAWDPWDHEAWELYLPFLDGGLSWPGMFAPVNEHRIFFARVLSLGQFLFNGQWDNRFECILTNGMFALMAAGLWWILRGMTPDRTRTTAVMIMVLFSLPYGWENIIWGLQSQFYFFLGFSLLGMWFTITRTPLSAGWWLGGFFLLSALFTTGSGVVPTIAVTIISLIRVVREGRASLKPMVWTLLLCAIMLVFYQHIAIREHNFGMKTKTLADGLLVFARGMSWPLSNHPWIMLIYWAPVAILAVRRLLFARLRVRPQEWFVFGLAGWCIINITGMAIYRGGFGTAIISRYADIAALSLLVNGAALLLLMREFGVSGHASRWQRAGLAWVLAAVAGLFELTVEDIRTRGLDRHDYQARLRETIVDFLAEDDFPALAALHQSALPHPDPLLLAACLRNEVIRSILPSSVRAPLDLEPEVQVGFRRPASRSQLYEKAWESEPPSRANNGAAFFNSKPLSGLTFPYLELEASGASGWHYTVMRYDQDNFSLKLKSIHGANAPVHVMPARDDGHLTVFRVKGDHPSLVATDRDLFRGMMFKEPREKSRASFWGDVLIHKSPWIMNAGLILGALLMTRKRTPA